MERNKLGRILWAWYNGLITETEKREAYTALIRGEDHWAFTDYFGEVLTDGKLVIIP